MRAKSLLRSRSGEVRRSAKVVQVEAASVSTKKQGLRGQGVEERRGVWSL